MKYMAWTPQQWAEASAWFARVHGYSPLPTPAGAIEVKQAWMIHHDQDPSLKRLIILPPEERPRRAERDVLMCDDPRLLPPLPLPRGLEENFDWAYRMFEVANGVV